MDCDRCPEEAVTYIRYSGAHLCSSHFASFVEKRVKRQVREQIRISKPTRIACALSGGKDSSVALYLLHSILGRRRDVELVAVTVDEGIHDYRPAGVASAETLCEELGIEHRIITYRELVGWEMDAVVAADPSTIPCSYCGVFRRKALNVLAKLADVDYLATGLNLDDTVQSILMNLGRADLDRLARMGPHDNLQPGLVPRVQPLRMIPDKEVYLYAVLKGIRFHDGICPYAERALRTRYREVLYMLERETPGTRHAFLSSYESLKPFLAAQYPPADLSTCEKCGEPTVNKLCQSCKLVGRLATLSQKPA
ncbi:MAG: TIGR00269 family protein [Thermoplasmata archaeon]